jgi:hypothetical protein
MQPDTREARDRKHIPKNRRKRLGHPWPLTVFFSLRPSLTADRGRAELFRGHDGFFFERLHPRFAHVSASRAMNGRVPAVLKRSALPGRGVMTSTWQIYQTRLAALLREQPTPAPSWPPSRRVARIRCQSTPCVGDGLRTSLTQLVRLPGIWRPDCAPLPVQAR